MKLKKILIMLFVIALGATATYAQDKAVAEREAYLKTITQRAEKIADGLGLTDADKKAKVSVVIRDQYDDLNNIYIARDARVKELKEKYADKTAREAELAKDNTAVMAQLAKLHTKYLKKLRKELSAQQVEAVKNGMTYNVAPNTYRAYQDQLLALTDAQKQQILTWLTEAREFAMDAESSEKKHAWFGKYKGKINNYLSAQGYDLKKESAEWDKRRKAAAQSN